MTTLEELTAEAAELYPYQHTTDHLRRCTYVRAKTITAEQVEQAAKGWHEATNGEGSWERTEPRIRELVRIKALGAFRAAGFYVEGEE